MKKSSRILALIISALMILSVLPFAIMADGEKKSRFEDVATDAYYFDAVMWAYENGITTGTTATKFAPTHSCTRGQVVTFLWRAMGEPVPTSANPFRDVKAGDYYYSAVLWAVEEGITNGTSANMFSPERTCSVAHIVTFIYRAFGEPGKTGEGEWYSDAINWASTSGLIEGTESAKADAAKLNSTDCPRADVVTILYRYKGQGTLTVYVAPGGNDATGDGTYAKPYATIDAARKAVRKLDKSQYKGITISIAKGEYQISAPITLSAEDSGTEDCPISYIGENGVTVIGGIKLTATNFRKAEGDFTRYFSDDVRDKMVMADMKPFGITAEMIQEAMGAKYNYFTAVPFLSSNGQRQMLAQYPNDFLHVGETVTHSADGTTNTAIDGVTLQTVDYGADHAEFVQSWSEVLPVFVRARLMKLWCPDDTRVAKIYKDEAKVDILFGGGHEPEKGTILYFYNVPEAVDVPGEYIYDNNANLYYYPTDDFETATLTVPLSKSLLVDKDADYITFSNIAFTSCLGDGLVINADNIAIRHCTVSSIQSTAMNIKGDNILLESNTVFDVGEDGIDLHTGDEATLRTGGTIIYNNDVSECSVTNAYGYCIDVFGVDILVAHNYVHDSNFKGIHTAASVDVIIKYNDCERMMLLCDDVGALSADSKENINIVFRYNYVHEIGPVGEAAKIKDYNPDYRYYGANAFYYDNGCSYIQTYSNIVNGCDDGILSNGGRYNTCNNNLFMNCRSWYVNFSHWTYGNALHDDGTLDSEKPFASYVYTNAWKARNPDLASLVLDPSTTSIDDKMIWCAPSFCEAHDNVIVYNKAERTFTNWGVRPYNIEKYVQMYSGDAVVEDISNMTSYSSARNQIDIREMVEKYADVTGVTLDMFNTIGKVN